MLHYAKNSGNFGQKSKEKVCFSPVQLEHSGPPLKMAHFDWWDWSNQNLQFYANRQVHCPASLQYISCREFMKGIKMVGAILLSWPSLIRKYCSISFCQTHWSLTGHSGIMESTQHFLPICLKLMCF